MGDIVSAKKGSLLAKVKNKDKGNVIQNIKEVLEEELEGRNLSQLPSTYIKEFYEKEGLADEIARNIHMNKAQLRKHFAMLKRIKMRLKSLKPNDEVDDETKILLAKLSFLLAYASSRKEAGRPVFDKNLYELVDFLLKKVREGTRKDFEIFESLFEAIIAFHTYYESLKGGKKHE